VERFKKRRRSWLIHVIPILVLLMVGSDISAIEGVKLRELHSAFGWAVSLMPILASALYLSGGLLLRNTRIGGFAWIVSFLAACLLDGAPSAILNSVARPIQVKRFLTNEELGDFTNKFGLPFAEYSATGEGTRVLIRRSDFNPAILSYFRSIHVLDDAPGKAPEPRN
jgi:hypothetical protein